MGEQFAFELGLGGAENLCGEIHVEFLGLRVWAFFGHEAAESNRTNRSCP